MLIHSGVIWKFYTKSVIFFTEKSFVGEHSFVKKKKKNLVPKITGQILKLKGFKITAPSVP